VDLVIEALTSMDDLAEADLAATCGINNAVWEGWLPGEPALTVEAFADEERFTSPPEVVVRRLARDASGRVVGWARVHWRDGEPGACNLRVQVDPGHRGHGVGRALASELVEVARKEGRAGVTLEVPVGSPADEICQRAGLKADMVVEMNRAAVGEVDRSVLERWQAIGESAAGYSLVTYDAPCADDDLAADFVAARHVMNDAPRWEGEEEWHYTTDELRGVEEAASRAHLDWWSVGVRHDGSGRIVGLSELYLPGTRPWIAFQGDTGVAADHRGHGLGAWMKAVNHQRLRAERPQTETVQTWNAAANEPMLRINRALGFRPVQRFRGWYLPLD
jgi:GNAT superfamily N-acetyltransferase